MQGIFSHYTMQALYEAARKVLENGESPELLRQPLDELKLMADFRETSLGQAILAKAASLYSPVDDLDVAIDRDTILYHNDQDGYWVLSWCFVADCDVGSTVEIDTDVPPVIVTI